MESGRAAALQVRIRFCSFIKFKSGLENITVRLDSDGTIDNLIESLDQEYGKSLVRFLKVKDRDKVIALFVRNNKILKRDEQLDDGDELTVMPAIGGG